MRIAVRSPEKTCRTVRVSPALSATPNHTRPTGFSAEPPPGPAMPVMATASPARGEEASAPSAMAAAVSMETAPWESSAWSGNAKNIPLGGIAVGHQPAVENCRGAGDVRDGRRDHAASTGLGGDDHHFGGCGASHQNFGKLAEAFVWHQFSPH